jgi:hypothetical protein
MGQGLVTGTRISDTFHFNAAHHALHIQTVNSTLLDDLRLRHVEVGVSVHRLLPFLTVVELENGVGAVKALKVATELSFTYNHRYPS